MKILCVILTCFVLAFPLVMLTSSSGIVALADDETVDEIDDTEATVEEESGGDEDQASVPIPTEKENDTEEEEEEIKYKPSPDAETTLHFITPIIPTELPATKPVRLLVGFINRGGKDFTVDAMDASFHYPQDYSYYIHNFTVIHYAHIVEPMKEATFEYGFTPSEMFGSRPFVLTVSIHYRDSENVNYVDPVFNETITIVEPDEGLDGETFFLYIFLAAVVALAVFAAYHFLSSFRKKHLTSKPKTLIETGTQNKNDVDYDWLPREHLEALNKSPGRSGKSKSSPRLRSAAATKRRSGGADD